MGKRIVIDYGGKIMEIPEESLERYQKGSDWLMEQCKKVGRSTEECQRAFGLKILKEVE